MVELAVAITEPRLVPFNYRKNQTAAELNGVLFAPDPPRTQAETRTDLYHIDSVPYWSSTSLLTVGYSDGKKCIFTKLGRRVVVTALVIREYFVQPRLVRNAL
jgi:hypothetical protein